MTVILYAFLLLGILGGVFGLLLAVASRVFEVKKDPRIEEVRNTLPGFNCGGCGFGGCSACAEAIVAGSVPVNACPSCTAAQTTYIASIMGVEVTETERRVAFVRCSGGSRANKKYEYVGIPDCNSAIQVSGNGPLECAYGCLGFGNCVRVCRYDAMHINSWGVAEVDWDKCTNCGRCREVCPRHLIIEVPRSANIVVGCASQERGAVARSTCTSSCITCHLCEKNCPSGAVSIKNNVVVIDYTKCTACGTCVSKCPRKVIRSIYADGHVVPVVPATKIG